MEEANILEQKIIDYPRPGEQIGHFRIKSLLDKNSLYVSYKAMDTLRAKYVNLKILSKDLLEHFPEIHQKVLLGNNNNKEILERHFIKVLDTNSVNGISYIVTEHYEGASLKQIVKKFGTIDPLKSMKIGIEVAKILEELQKYKLVHKDIKPANIFICKDSKILLDNFDLSSVINIKRDEQFITKRIYGLPHYTAPEQFLNNEYDFKADLYSLGASLYHIVTGFVPFQSDNFSNLISMHRNIYPDPPEVINQSIGREFSNMIMRLMEKDPEKRHRNYSELINDLKDIAFKHVQNSKAEKKAS